ncbi:hypothetical protein GOV06_02410 [Candidatus Woesearchaeota archaeon]|nr:hypothetical protein [Candidatus Woesearchaeota archaeon]
MRGIIVKKRGQITLFIILGIIILILVGSFFLIRSFVTEKKLTPELIHAISEMPAELRPVRIYTEECLSAISEEALRKLGDQGGYISPEAFAITASSLNPTEADGIQFSPGSNLKIPYWHYLHAPNDCKGNCEFNSLRPPLYRTSGEDNSIEAQVDKYVDEQLKICLNNYAPFIEQGFEIEEKGRLKTTTLIGDFDVSIFIDYPLEIRKGDTTHDIERFYVSHPLKLKEMYDLATDITTAETEYTFLETQVLNLITAFSALDPDSLPPKTEVEVNFAGGTIWSEIKVKQDIESVLSPYINAIQVPFTLDYEKRIFPGNNIKTAFYSMEIPVNFEKRYDYLSVNFDYLGWWPIYFDLDCHGDLCQPESVNNPLLTIIGIQRYDFSYDVSFPVLVDITDPDAFNERGYSFKFALESNVRNNKPLNDEFPGYSKAVIPTSTLLCAPTSKNSGNITVKVKDAVNQKALPDAQVMYTCGSESCAIGTTDNKGDLVSPFPICLGGVISFLKDDYFIPSQPLNAKTDKEELVVAEGYPYADKKIIVEKFIYNTRQKQLSQNPTVLEQDEEIVLTLTKIPDSEGEAKLTTFAKYRGDQSEPSEMLQLIPGTYDVDSTMMLYRLVIVPEETRSTGVGLIGSLLGADEEYTIPEVRFENGYPSGGVIFNENTGYLEITPDDLYNNDKIIFYAIGPTIPEHIEEISPEIEPLSSRYRSIINPLFEK